MWTHAINETEGKYAVLLNNRVKDSQSSGHGLLNAKQRDPNSGNATGVRVPILQKIKLTIPF